MRALSLKQAINCEMAIGSVCRCRCEGALHGAKRNGDQMIDREFFASLPEDDPHYKKPEKSVKKARKPSDQVDFAYVDNESAFYRLFVQALHNPALHHQLGFRIDDIARIMGRKVTRHVRRALRVAISDGLIVRHRYLTENNGQAYFYTITEKVVKQLSLFED